MSISGKYLTVTVGSGVGEVEVADNYAWSVDQGGDNLDRTTGADGGKSRTDVGVEDTKIDIKLYLDIATGQPSLVRRGTTLTNLNLYRASGDADPAYTFPEALVLNRREGGEVRGKLELFCQITAQGDYDENDP
ncbi:unnamed protein product [Gemmataceae bacterium]|nr:unnamed protein product [Gemmataceae bacterium]VTT98938.1 unnamed protein product [Gemmataceae bacterium]